MNTDTKRNEERAQLLELVGLSIKVGLKNLEPGDENYLGLALADKTYGFAIEHLTRAVQAEAKALELERRSQMASPADHRISQLVAENASLRDAADRISEELAARYRQVAEIKDSARLEREAFIQVIAELAPRVVDPTCWYCHHKRAVCFGTGDDSEVPVFCCGSCCSHRTDDDHWCVPVGKIKPIPTLVGPINAPAILAPTPLADSQRTDPPLVYRSHEPELPPDARLARAVPGHAWKRVHDAKACDVCGGGVWLCSICEQPDGACGACNPSAIELRPCRPQPVVKPLPACGAPPSIPDVPVARELELMFGSGADETARTVLGGER